MSHPPKRFESVSQAGLFYWSERNPGAIESYAVLAQAEGGPASEAWDDWFTSECDADDVAAKLAKGEL